jgi:methylenetetrahydrofolate reductase (NADPH)
MKKIIDLYLKSIKPLFSFEFFPPKTSEGENKLKNTIAELKVLNPAFVSVTYGAGGSTRDKTIDICAEIQLSNSIISMAHFTCVGADKGEIYSILKKIESSLIQNIIALRGDPPAGEGKFIPFPNGFANATELIEFIKQSGFDFGIAGGSYPEKHPDSPTPELDIMYLKKKVDSGADFLITQLFFDNSKFISFLENSRKAGIQVPIIPGIMPITNYTQIDRFKNMANCAIPIDLVNELTLLKDNPTEFLKASIRFTVQQCRELLDLGLPGIHFYTLNQSKATIDIMKSLI